MRKTTQESSSKLKLMYLTMTTSTFTPFTELLLRGV